MIRTKQIIATLFIAGLFCACKKDKDPVIIIPPSSGSTVQLNGIIGSEPGSSAGNSVFMDLSTDKQTAVARNSWDLGFYAGTEFRVIINNTTSATAKVLAVNDLSLAGPSDTVGLNQLALGFDVASWDLVDNPLGVLSQTVIPAIAANEADNKVVIINPGTGGSITARDWYKIRVLRNAGGYTLQYAKLAATSYSTINIAKDADYNFNYISLEAGSPVNVEPVKSLWDFSWSYKLYQTAFGADLIPYAFSDLIMLNHHNGVQAAEILTSSVSYENYTKSNIESTTFSSEIDVIGSKWRKTTGSPLGVQTDRFYVIKDASGNVYKLKFLAMGAGDDGGTRGKPEFSYQLVQ